MIRRRTVAPPLRSVILLLLSIWLVPLLGREDRERFLRTATDEKLYLHAFLDYAHDPLARLDWWARRFVDSGIRLTTGSVTTNDLMVDGDLHLNVALGDGWWFRYQGEYTQLRHRDADRIDHVAGLERRFGRHWGLFLTANAAAEKERIDIRTGLMIASDDTLSYARLAVILEDVVWEQKNPRRGDDERRPFGLRWALRTERGPWQMISEGEWSTGYARHYPDLDRSPDLFSEARRMREALTVVARRLSGGRWLWAEGEAYAVRSEREEPEAVAIPPDHSVHGGAFAGRLAGSAATPAGTGAFYPFPPVEDATRTVDYRNGYWRLGFGFWQPLGGGRHLYGEGHRLVQDGEDRGGNPFRYDRAEWLGSLTARQRFGSQALDVRVLASAHEWTWRRAGLPTDERTDVVEKFKIIWTRWFAERGVLTLALSHSFSLGGFGGGHLRWQVVF